MDRANASQAMVFVVDDDEEVLRSVDRLLRSAGWAVEGYSHGEAFLERLPYDGVGCVLLDVQMPGMTGPELQEKILEAGVGLPIIYLTGRADVPMSISAMKRGAMDILLKPVADDLVLSAIHAALARHDSMRAEACRRAEITRRMSRLSVREREVMECVISGRLNKQTADDLGITEKTVKAHRARVMEKLETRSVASIVRMCAALGIEPRACANVRASGAPALRESQSAIMIR